MLSIAFATTDLSSAQYPDGTPMLGGAGHYRIGLPARYLAEHGFEVALGELAVVEGERGHRALTVKRFSDGVVVQPPDLMVLQRYMHAGMAEAIIEARRAGQVVVQDCDDAFFHLDPRNHAARTTDARVQADYNRDHYAAAIAASDALTVSTPDLARLLRAKFPKLKIVLLRNAIDLASWTPRETTDERPRVCGWIGALPWRSGDFDTAEARAIGSWVNAEGLEFRHGGHVELGDDASARADSVAAKHWVPSAGEQIGCERWSTAPICDIEAYRDLWAPLEISVVPLRDCDFNRSKSALKLLQGAAAGVPSIAQALPEQRWLVEQGIGRYARSPSDWRRLLTRCLDPSYRADEAARGLEAVKAFDMEVRGDDWASVYRGFLA